MGHIGQMSHERVNSGSYMGHIYVTYGSTMVYMGHMGHNHMGQQWVIYWLYMGYMGHIWVNHGSCMGHMGHDLWNNGVSE